jgi:hypothetical protein
MRYGILEICCPGSSKGATACEDLNMANWNQHQTLEGKGTTSLSRGSVLTVDARMEQSSILLISDQLWKKPMGIRTG